MIFIILSTSIIIWIALATLIRNITIIVSESYRPVWGELGKLMMWSEGSGASTERLASFNVTQREKKTNCHRGSSLSVHLSSTETRCYNSTAAGCPKITPRNVRTQSVSQDQERRAATSCPLRLQTRPDRTRTSSLLKRFLTQKDKSVCRRVAAKMAETSSSFISGAGVNISILFWYQLLILWSIYGFVRSIGLRRKEPFSLNLFKPAPRRNFFSVV